MLDKEEGAACEVEEKVVECGVLGAREKKHFKEGGRGCIRFC